MEDGLKLEHCPAPAVGESHRTKEDQGTNEVTTSRNKVDERPTSGSEMGTSKVEDSKPVLCILAPHEQSTG
ncbi:unnamed protein product [Rhizopus stolonifer]